MLRCCATFVNVSADLGDEEISIIEILSYLRSRQLWTAMLTILRIPLVWIVKL